MKIKPIFGFFADIFKQVLVKIITWILVIVFFFFAIKYFLKIDLSGFF